MRSDALERRRRIITAAAELFRTQPEIVALETIAERAGVGIATLYRNFPDRSALLYACGAYFFEQALALQQEILESFDEHPADSWNTYVDELVDMGISHLVSTFAPDDLSNLPDNVAKLRHHTQHNGERILRKAKDHGLVAENISYNTFIIGLITVTRPPVPGILALEPRITDQLVSLYLGGLAAGLQTPPPQRDRD